MLKLNASLILPFNNLDIALVIPHAGHSQLENMPVVGQSPLKIKGKMKCLNTHFTGEYFTADTGVDPNNMRIDVKLITIACGEPKLRMSKTIFFNLNKKLLVDFCFILIKKIKK